MIGTSVMKELKFVYWETLYKRVTKMKIKNFLKIVSFKFYKKVFPRKYF